MTNHDSTERRDSKPGDTEHSPGADLRPEEAADAMEEHDEARTSKPTRDDHRDDDGLITLDTPD